jgi:hypothetical protein
MYYLQHVRHLLQATFEIFAGLHEIFDIINIGEIDLESLEELRLSLGQLGVGEDAE